MKHTILALALFTTLAAHATEPVKPPKHPGGYIKTPQQLTVTVSPSSASSATAAPSSSAAYSNPTVTASPTVIATPSASAAAGSASANNGGVNVQASNRAATAFAAPVAGTNGTCLGGVSGGVQGALGVSFSSTKIDAGCDARYDANALQNLGLHAAAQARLCLKPEIAQAMADAGMPCKAQAKAEGTGLAVVAGTSHTGEQ